MKKRFLSLAVLLIVGFMTSFMCSACSFFDFFSNQEEVVTITFYAEGDVYKKIYVGAGDMIALPKYESKTHTLNGWKLRGEGALMSGTFIANESTYFTADLNDTGFRILTYQVNGEVYQTELVKIGEEFALIKAEDTVSHIFNGWKVNGKGDLLLASSVYKIESNTTLVADLTDTGYRLLTYQVGDKLYRSVKVEKGKSFELLSYGFDVAPYDNSVSCVFNGWQVNGKGSLLTGSYTVTENTTLIARIVDSGYREVIYQADGKVYQTVKVKKGRSFSLLDYTPEHNIYLFKGWQLNGQGDFLTGYYITNENVTFVAKLEDTGKRVVTYEVNGQVYHTAVVNKGEAFNLIQYGYDVAPYDSKLSYKFNGWKIKGQSNLLPSSYSVVDNLTFVADFTDTGKRLVDYMIHELLVPMLLDKGPITLPEIENIEGYENEYDDQNETFVGWRVNEEGELLKAGTTYVLNDYTILNAVFEPHYWVTKTWTGALGNEFDGQYVWSDGDNCYYSNGKLQYKLVGNEWVTKTWQGDLTEFEASDIWYTGKYYYCSIYNDGNYSHYYLDYGRWKKVFPDINFHAERAWSFNGKYFYDLYEWTKDSGYTKFISPGFTSTDPSMLENFNGALVWSDSTNCYYSDGSKTFKLEGYHWKEISSYNSTSDAQYCYGALVWTDGKNAYFNQINKSEVKVWKNEQWLVFEEWYGIVPFSADHIWTDGTNYYYSSGTDQYILNKTAIRQKVVNIK